MDFMGVLQLPRNIDLDRLLGYAPSACLLDHTQDIHSFRDLTKNDMLAVQMWCSTHVCNSQVSSCFVNQGVQKCLLFEGDKKLRTIGVRPSVSHGKKARTIMLDIEILIVELGTIDRLAYRLSAAYRVISVEATYNKESKGGWDRLAPLEVGEMVVPSCTWLIRTSIPSKVTTLCHESRNHTMKV